MRDKLIVIFESLKKYAIWLVVAGVVVVSYVLITDSNKNGIEYATVSVLRGNIDQVVDASGSLESVADIDLSFRRAGQVDKVYVDVGDYVKAGDLLAEIENAQERAELSQSRAVLSEAQANLNLKQANALQEDVAIAAAGLDEVKAGENKYLVDLENARANLENVKMTVAQEIESGEIELENASLQLEKVMANVNADSDQNIVSVDNAVVSIKSAIGKLLSIIAGGHQTIDKIYGEFGPTQYDDKLVLFKKRIQSYTDLKAKFMKNVAKYDAIILEYELLGAVPSSDDMTAFEVEFDVLADDTKTMIFAIQDLMDDVIVSVDLNYVDLDALRSEINSFATSFDTARSAYDTARNNYDTAVISKSGDDLTLPMDVRVAEMNLSQVAVELEHIKVNGEVKISDAEANVKVLEAQVEVQNALIGSANASLNKVVSGPRAVDVEPYRARIAQASAQVARAQSMFEDTMIKAPIDGVITIRKIEPGEYVMVSSASSGGPLMRMIDDSEFVVEVDIPETKISRLNFESEVTVSFDALDGMKFEGVIKSIEPASTKIDEVIYYVVKVGLVEKDERLKEGMTADVYIQVMPKENVLVIPEKAIVRDDGRYWVLVPEGTGGPDAIDAVGSNGYQKLEVRTGIRGISGDVEILSGLEEGMQILVPKI